LTLLDFTLYSGLAVEPNNADGPDRDGIFNMAAQAGTDESSQARRTITMYRDGFVVDDGPYRRLEDPANADFLRALATGTTPPELMDVNDGNITVGLVDKRSEEYVENFQSFSGAGAALGTSAVQGNTVEAASLPPAVEVDASRPSTSIQVRLPNGQRKVIKINLDSSVLQLAANARPLLGEDVTSFRLISGFPPKPLEEFQATVEGAGLKGAQVQIQKA
jgi:UBX domain-containing protein 1